MRSPVDLEVRAAPPDRGRLDAVVHVLETEAGIPVDKTLVVGPVPQSDLFRDVSQPGAEPAKRCRQVARVTTRSRRAGRCRAFPTEQERDRGDQNRNEWVFAWRSHDPSIAGFYPFYSADGCTVAFGDVTGGRVNDFGGLAGYGSSQPFYFFGFPPIYGTNGVFYSNGC